MIVSVFSFLLITALFGLAISGIIAGAMMIKEGLRGGDGITILLGLITSFAVVILVSVFALRLV